MRNVQTVAKALRDDIDEFKDSRGFIEDDIRSFMPVDFTETYEDLILNLNNILENKYNQTYRHEDKFNEIKHNFSENIYNTIIKE